MLWAEDENGNKMEATPGSEGTCSICGEKVHSKCGEINVWHWNFLNTSPASMIVYI